MMSSKTKVAEKRNECVWSKKVGKEVWEFWMSVCKRKFFGGEDFFAINFSMS